MNNFRNMVIHKVQFIPKKELRHFITQHICQKISNNSSDQLKQLKEIICLQ
jgi:hypothetical protein